MEQILFDKDTNTLVCFSPVETEKAVTNPETGKLEIQIINEIRYVIRLESKVPGNSQIGVTVEELEEGIRQIKESNVYKTIPTSTFTAQEIAGGIDPASNMYVGQINTEQEELYEQDLIRQKEEERVHLESPNIEPK